MATLTTTNKDRKIEVLVDDDDYPWLRQWGWWVDSAGYIKATIEGKFVLMHRLIMGADNPAIHIDHKNGLRHDNRRENLRPSDINQNYWNRKVTSRSSSGYRGVYECRVTGKWKADIMAEGQRYSLGKYNTPEEAARVRDAKARELYGEFAWVNIESTGEELPQDATHPKNSKYRGVCWDATYEDWVACLYVDKVRRYLGRFNDQDAAGRAVRDALLEFCPHRARQKKYANLFLIDPPDASGGSGPPQA